jgi:hypothetical protein
MQEALSTFLPQVHGQSLDSWVDRRQGQLADESLRRIEDFDPGHSAAEETSPQSPGGRNR